ncbi:hypothetical protein [Acetobacterium bakii]|uniref:Uncharacterized protein n=1 Tax=Acetobacterium bakii TaxID=52689 RepID=A0A0L6TWD7_9FIRM|nr:hypothetical protein [Acetobacterium bakii]KNZ40591.1 hypothetical protein AKG39_16715 [Acetobacterium bakii]
MKGHFWQTIFFVIFWNIIISVMFVVIIFILEIIAFFSLRQLMGNTMALSIFIASFGFLVIPSAARRNQIQHKLNELITPEN